MSAGAAETRHPRARHERLLTYEVAGETLVYDLDRHVAHRLATDAAALWRWCDGRTTIAEMADHLAQRCGVPMDVDLVEAELRRLSRAGLVTGLPRPRGARVRNRRECLRQLGLLGGLAVMTIAVPTPSQAASCVTGDECRRGDTPPCAGLPCCGGGRCQRQGNHCQCR